MTARRNPPTAPMTAPEIVAVFRDWVPLPIHKKPTYAKQRVQRMIRMYMGALLLEFPILA